MLVQTRFSELNIDGMYVAEAYCSRCGGSIGNLNRDELTYLINEPTGQVLCFDCETLCPKPCVPLTDLEIQQRQEEFDYPLDEPLPVGAASAWRDDTIGVHLQYTVDYGWEVYITATEDGQKKWRLARTRCTYYQAAQLYQRMFKPVPMRFSEPKEIINHTQGLVDGMAIDREIAENEPCGKCGGKCTYRAETSDGYRAFAVCTVCGEEVEF
jgi:hypothetical protein